jgi:hypothetical protein
VQAAPALSVARVWRLFLVAIVAALTTTSVHRGSILPAARVIVLGVPLTFAFLYWLLIVRNRNRPK